MFSKGTLTDFGEGTIAKWRPIGAQRTFQQYFMARSIKCNATRNKAALQRSTIWRGGGGSSSDSFYELLPCAVTLTLAASTSSRTSLYLPCFYLLVRLVCITGLHISARTFNYASGIASRSLSSNGPANLRPLQYVMIVLVVCSKRCTVNKHDTVISRGPIAEDLHKYYLRA